MLLDSELEYELLFEPEFVSEPEFDSGNFFRI